ncbi:ABC-F family ATP-binding cassette domain-containing protein [Ferrimonas pelagia]|uniref:ATP-binding cassette domain-containing protein n=1 Tax=Ferrimonas pelagia TaxID=1177826 RepID=A0ABP9FI50_9GAMM
MPPLHFSQLSHRLADGRILFDNLQGTLGPGLTALIGRNGAGKSLLCQLLCDQQPPQSGQITRPEHLVYVPQQPPCPEGSLADMLGLTPILQAQRRIENGEFDETDLARMEGNWDAVAQAQTALEQLNLPHTLAAKASALSGGERVKLRLWQAFAQRPQVLILDEPGNHLDRAGRYWLRQRLSAFSGSVLLVSHDLSLLSQVERVWDLTEQGLAVYEGNYADYLQHKAVHSAAIVRALANADRALKHHRAQQLRNEQKAQQRVRQGKAKRGSHPKVLLDAMKDRATAACKGRRRQAEQTEQHLRQSRCALSQKQAKDVRLRLTLGPQTSELSSRRAVVRQLDECQLPFGSQQPLQLTLHQGQRYRLLGANGSGKTTLFKVLLGQLAPAAGQVQGQAPIGYLDQHCQILSGQASALAHLARFDVGESEAQRRTQLAGIGLRRDDALRPVAKLSGGEKMKLAMLLLGQGTSPPFLLLDEPDNHLDLEAKAVLIAALNNYPGGFLLISHDDGFADAVNIEQILALGSGSHQPDR